MLRLFAGLAIPENIRARLRLMQGGIEGARWTAKENFHVTLTFIGEVDEATAQDIDEALAAIRAQAFSLRLKGTGSFAQGDDPKVLWMGVEHDARLPHLKDKIDRALQMARIEFDKRKYVPHVTMARFRRNPDEAAVGEFMRAYNLFDSGAFDVREFILYNSASTKNGVAYEALAVYPLL